MNGMNLRRFEFDYDATWTAFFTDSKLNVYSRYGGRDQGDPEARLSKPSLLHTMNQVLAAHQEVLVLRAAGQIVPPSLKPNTAIVPPAKEPPNSPRPSTSDRERPNVGLPLFQPISEEVKKPEEMLLLKKSHQGCIHCHQVKEYSLLQAYHDGRFSRDLLFTFPFPESLGIEINRVFGHRIAKIRPESAASIGGLQMDDEIARINDVPIRSELDLRWALHRLSQSASQVTFLVRRPNSSKDTSEKTDSPTSLNKPADSKLVTLSLKLPNRWRESELSWRKSSRSIPADWGFRAAALTASQRRETNLPAEGLAIRVLSMKPRGLAAAVGLQKDDVIIALDGEKRTRTLEQLRSDIIRRFSPGDEIQLTIRRGNETLEIKGQFPPWFTEETSVP
ncbi:MAG: PDZ domain-containing protein [Planctomycetia bacterium]|nr:PDZ domain-containing protein [Planctomycetia bacterium]